MRDLKDKLDLLWDIIDIKSGAVLGVMSGIFILMTIISFATKGAFKVPDEFLSVYATAVTGVTVTKVTTMRMGGKKDESTKVDSPDA